MLSEIISYILAVLIFGTYFWIGVSRTLDRYRCQDKTTGTCIDAHFYTIHNITHSYARFEYVYNNKKYNQLAIDRLTTRQMKKLIPGNTYTLYVNPKKPSSFRCTKTVIRLEDTILITAFGLLFLGFLCLNIKNLLDFFNNMLAVGC